MTKREQNYLSVIRQSLSDLWGHLDTTLDQLPDDANYDQDESVRRIVGNVASVEEEWILCPIQRLELSLIEFETDEEK